MEIEENLSHWQDDFINEMSEDSNIFDIVFQFIDKINFTSRLYFDNDIKDELLASSYILIIKRLEKLQLSNDKQGFELFQILFNAIIEAKPPCDILLKFLYKINISK